MLGNHGPLLGPVLGHQPADGYTQDADGGWQAGTPTPPTHPTPRPGWDWDIVQPRQHTGQRKSRPSVHSAQRAQRTAVSFGPPPPSTVPCAPQG
jgi:hypothetical protein